MSIIQTEVVDFIYENSETNEVVLTVADHLPWEDEHFVLLTDKVSNYVNFVKSGDIFAQVPSASDKQIVIELIHEQALTVEATELLGTIENVLDSRDIKFKHRLLSLDAGESQLQARRLESQFVSDTETGG